MIITNSNSDTKAIVVLVDNSFSFPKVLLNKLSREVLDNLFEHGEICDRECFKTFSIGGIDGEIIEDYSIIRTAITKDKDLLILINVSEFNSDGDEDEENKRTFTLEKVKEALASYTNMEFLIPSNFCQLFESYSNFPGVDEVLKMFNNYRIVEPIDMKLGNYYDYYDVHDVHDVHNVPNVTKIQKVSKPLVKSIKSMNVPKENSKTSFLTAHTPFTKIEKKMKIVNNEFFRTRPDSNKAICMVVDTEDTRLNSLFSRFMIEESISTYKDDIQVDAQGFFMIDSILDAKIKFCVIVAKNGGVLDLEILRSHLEYISDAYRLIIPSGMGQSSEVSFEEIMKIIPGNSVIVNKPTLKTVAKYFAPVVKPTLKNVVVKSVKSSEVEMHDEEMPEQVMQGPEIETLSIDEETPTSIKAFDFSTKSSTSVFGKTTPVVKSETLSVEVETTPVVKSETLIVKAETTPVVKSETLIVKAETTPVVKSETTPKTNLGKPMNFDEKIAARIAAQQEKLKTATTGSYSKESLENAVKKTQEVFGEAIGINTTHSCVMTKELAAEILLGDCMLANQIPVHFYSSESYADVTGISIIEMPITFGPCGELAEGAKAISNIGKKLNSRDTQNFFSGDSVRPNFSVRPDRQVSSMFKVDGSLDSRFLVKKGYGYGSDKERTILASVQLSPDFIDDPNSKTELVNELRQSLRKLGINDKTGILTFVGFHTLISCYNKEAGINDETSRLNTYLHSWMAYYRPFSQKDELKKCVFEQFENVVGMSIVKFDDSNNMEWLKDAGSVVSITKSEDVPPVVIEAKPFFGLNPSKPVENQTPKVKISKAFEVKTAEAPEVTETAKVAEATKAVETPEVDEAAKAAKAEAAKAAEVEAVETSEVKTSEINDNFVITGGNGDDDFVPCGDETFSNNWDEEIILDNDMIESNSAFCDDFINEASEVESEVENEVETSFDNDIVDELVPEAPAKKGNMSLRWANGMKNKATFSSQPIAKMQEKTPDKRDVLGMFKERSEMKPIFLGE